MNSLELRWGLLIGLAGMVWLYLSYYLGFHTSGVQKVQIMVFVGLFVTFVAYFFAFLALVRNHPETTYTEGVKSGLVMTAVAALIAMLTQVGYFYLVNPDWTNYMVGQTEEHFRKAGLEGEQLAEKVEQAKTAFSFGSYLFQATMGALVMGTIFSAILMGVMILRKRR